LSVLGKLTVKPLLWAIGVLLLLAVGQFVLLQLAQGDVRVAEANLETARSDLNARTTERDAFALRVDELKRANDAWVENIVTLQGELKRAQRDARLLDQEARQAVAAARAEAADADRTLKQFVGQFAAESRRPHCAQALAAMEAACPAMSGY
jgi:hypothetical protein